MVFFVTSHGKSTFDGVGGTVKRLTARASLQRPFNDQVLSAQEMFTFCKDCIEGITFSFKKYVCSEGGREYPRKHTKTYKEGRGSSKSVRTLM